MNWDKKTLGEIYEIEGGSVQTGPFGSQLHESDYKEFGVPVIMPKDIKNDKLDLSNISFISDDDAKRLSQHIVKKDDIVCPRRGEIGKRILVDEANIGAFCGTGCIRLRGAGTILNQLFFFYFLKQPKVVKWIENQAIGATMMNLNTSILKSIPINYPPLPMQQKIASILSAYDELIENNKQRIKLLEEMAEEIYKEWFVRLRFPGYENTKIVDGLPEGWENGTIGNLYNVKSGFAFSADKFGDVGIPIIKIKNIDNLEVDTINCDRYSGEVNERIKKFELLNGDLIIAMTGATIGKVALFQKQSEQFYLNQRTGKFFKKHDWLNNQSLVYQFAKSTLFKEGINNIASGAAQPNISGEQIENIKMLIPDKELLLKFTKITGEMIDEIFILKDKNQLLQETRDLLLPRLISGRLSVEHLVAIEEENLLMAAEPMENYGKN